MERKVAWLAEELTGTSVFLQIQHELMNLIKFHKITSYDVYIPYFAQLIPDLFYYSLFAFNINNSKDTLEIFQYTLKIREVTHFLNNPKLLESCISSKTNQCWSIQKYTTWIELLHPHYIMSFPVSEFWFTLITNSAVYAAQKSEREQKFKPWKWCYRGYMSGGKCPGEAGQ